MRKRARRVHLGRHQAVQRVDRDGTRGAQVHVAQPQHQIRGLKDDAAHVLLGRQAVVVGDVLNVGRQVGRLGARAARVLLQRLVRPALVKGHRQTHDARRQHQGIDGPDRRVGGLDRRQQARQRQRALIILDHAAAHAGVGLDQAHRGELGERLLERVDARAQVEV